MDEEENGDACTTNQLCEWCRAASKTHAYVNRRGSEAGGSTPQIIQVTKQKEQSPAWDVSRSLNSM